MTRRYRPWTGIEVQRAAQMRASGMSYAAIGRELDRASYAVITVLRRQGLDSWVAQSHERPGYERQLYRAYHLRQEGMSYPKIAVHIRWHATHQMLRKALYRYVRRMNLPLLKGRAS